MVKALWFFVRWVVSDVIGKILHVLVAAVWGFAAFSDLKASGSEWLALVLFLALLSAVEGLVSGAVRRAWIAAHSPTPEPVDVAS